jgi:hypothetical protein
MPLVLLWPELEKADAECLVTDGDPSDETPSSKDRRFLSSKLGTARIVDMRLGNAENPSCTAGGLWPGADGTDGKGFWSR